MYLTLSDDFHIDKLTDENSINMPEHKSFAKYIKFEPACP